MTVRLLRTLKLAKQIVLLPMRKWALLMVIAWTFMVRRQELMMALLLASRSLRLQRHFVLGCYRRVLLMCRSMLVLLVWVVLVLVVLWRTRWIVRLLVLDVVIASCMMLAALLTLAMMAMLLTRVVGLVVSYIDWRRFVQPKKLRKQCRPGGLLNRDLTMFGGTDRNDRAPPM